MDNNNTLTQEEFNLLLGLIDVGIKTAGLQSVSDNLPAAVKKFAALRPDQPEPEKTEE
jgi:hypothetical protein|tara:strand:- start:4251 stop:4424 length:174 start_codon:yes stop_codon:yes gene_type:complete